MKKRIFSVLLAFAIALTAVLCGCGDKSAGTPTGAGAASPTEQTPQETAPVSTPEGSSQETAPVSTPEGSSRETAPVSTPEESPQVTPDVVETAPAGEPVEMRVTSSVDENGEGTVTVTFSALPTTLEQITCADGAVLDSPFKTAALTVCALCVFSQSEEDGIKLLNALRGPEPLSDQGIKFLQERFGDIGGYVPFSYFDGATPDNDYTPDQPLTVTVFTTPYSYDADGYANLYISSGGADNARSVMMRKKPSTGEWFLQEQYLMVQIRIPTSQDPWA